MKQKVSYIKSISSQALHDGSCSFYWVHQPNGYLFIYLSIMYPTRLCGSHFNWFGFPPTLLVIWKAAAAKEHCSHTWHLLSPNFPLFPHGVILHSGLVSYLTNKITLPWFLKWWNKGFGDFFLEKSRYYGIFYSL